MPNWSGLYDGVHGTPHALLNEPDAYLRGIARLSAPQAQLGRAEVGVELTGAAVGATADASIMQRTAVQANGLNQGGQVPIAAVSYVNRITTAADAAVLDAQLQPKFAPTTYPPDLSGNGGGGHTYSY